MATNNWILQNKQVLESIKTKIIEYNLKGNYGGNLPLEHIIRLFNGAELEIRILQGEVDRLRLALEQEKKKQPKVEEPVKK